MSSNTPDFSCLNRNWLDLTSGECVSFQVLITSDLISQFSKITFDYSEIHTVNKSSGQTVAHGMLLSSFFSTIVGMFLPGKNALLISHETVYINSLNPDSIINVSGVLKKKIDKLKLLEISCKISFGGLLICKSKVFVKYTEND